MAGMLAGVECARRRRFHQSVASTEAQIQAAYGSTRRSSLCLYTSNHENPLASISSSTKRRMVEEDEKLGGVAREAKERLDEKFRGQRESEIRRPKNRERLMETGELDTEVFGSKKKGSRRRRFSWIKLSWKSLDQDECVICLDHFKAGDTLLHLPCAHRFHSRCLLPWLNHNSLCPYCRMSIISH